RSVDVGHALTPEPQKRIREPELRRCRVQGQSGMLHAALATNPQKRTAVLHFRGKTYIRTGRNHPCHSRAATVFGVAPHEATQNLSRRYDPAPRRGRPARYPGAPYRGRRVLRAVASAAFGPADEHQATANVAGCDEPRRQTLSQTRRSQRRRPPKNRAATPLPPTPAHRATSGSVGGAVRLAGDRGRTDRVLDAPA